MGKLKAREISKFKVISRVTVKVQPREAEDGAEHIVQKGQGISRDQEADRRITGVSPAREGITATEEARGEGRIGEVWAGGRTLEAPGDRTPGAGAGVMTTGVKAMTCGDKVMMSEVTAEISSSTDMIGGNGGTPGEMNLYTNLAPRRGVDSSNYQLVL